MALAVGHALPVELPAGSRPCLGPPHRREKAHVHLPRALKRRRIVRRQLGGFVEGDGVTARTWDHVESAYFTALDRLEAIFSRRRFLLGDAPSIADFAMMGPMLRHFGQDPTPADLMRSRAPLVYEWVARTWNTRAVDRATGWIPAIDAPLAELIREACETHLVQLRENAIAVAAGKRRFCQEVQGVRYEDLPSGRYRVWCLEALRREWAALDEGTRNELRPFLTGPGASVLWDATTPLGSGYDTEQHAPFNRALNVFDKDVRSQGGLRPPGRRRGPGWARRGGRDSNLQLPAATSRKRGDS